MIRPSATGVSGCERKPRASGDDPEEALEAGGVEA